jgi:hypothetical protein
VSFATTTICVASQVIWKVSVYIIIDSVWKLLDTPLYIVRLLETSYDTDSIRFYGGDPDVPSFKCG